jgi:N-acetylmuramoyl-L-alanine amidase
VNARLALPRALGALALIALAGACAPRPTAPLAPRPVPYVPVSPALPPIPEVEAPLAIRVVHPTPGTPKPRVDSTFVFGSVGTGGAALSINGTPVPVAPNGAFLAYLPVPENGVYELTAAKGGQQATATAAYRAPAAAPPPAAAAAPAVPEGVFAAPRAGVVTGGADTLATGSDAVYARPTPTGTYRWFLPRGARLRVLERRGEQYRVALDTTSAWIPASAVTLADTAPAAPTAPTGSARLRRTGGTPELVVPARGAPFLVEVGDSALTLTVYGAAPRGTPAALPASDPYVRAVAVDTAGGAHRYRLSLARGLWGYKAWYDPDGMLVLRLRPPPAIDPAQPLRGRRIVIDPGHPPGGATGPTGLTEAEANLAISLRLANLLRARGAEVIMTRTENVAVGLSERTRMAVERDAELLVSVHNNAFGEGANPFRQHHTTTYYFQPFSAGLASALNQEIVAVTRLPNHRAQQGNLALVRPTWMPSALTESLFMMIPEQEAALRNPEFLDRLADAHARGIEEFFRSRAAR